MKSILRSKVLIASLAANIALAAFVLVHFLGPRDESATSPVHGIAPLQRAAESPTAASQVTSVESAPEATVVSALPAPASRPSGSQLIAAPLSAPSATGPAASLAQTSSRSAPSSATQSIVPSGIPSGQSYQAPRPAIAEPFSPGPASPVNSSAPGNSFVSRGVRVAVAETYPATEDGGTPLGIDLGPTGTANSSSEDAGTEGTAIGAGNENPRNEIAKGDDPANFSAGGSETPNADKALSAAEEEDLFRMKWGWAAFDAAQTEAMREQDNRKQP